jgi:glycerol-3-phosphate acyltransferase PlsX
VRIAVDAMGGDRGPQVVVPGAIEAARARPGEIKLVLVGRENDLRPFVRRADPSLFEIVHASESIDMHESPAQAIRRKKEASITVALRLVREGNSWFPVMHVWLQDEGSVQAALDVPARFARSE